MSQPPPAHTHTPHTPLLSAPHLHQKLETLGICDREMFLKIGLSRSRSYWLFHPPPLPSLEITERSSTSSLSSSSSSSSSSLSLFSFPLSRWQPTSKHLRMFSYNKSLFLSLSSSLLLYCDTFCLFLLTGRLCCRYSCKSQTHTVRYIIRKANKREIRQSEKTKPKKHTFLCPSSHIPSASASVQPSLSYANQACSSFPAFPPPPSPLPALFFYALMLLPAVTLRAKCRKCAP